MMILIHVKNKAQLFEKSKPTGADHKMKPYAQSDPMENQMFDERVKLERKVDICVRCFKF